MLYKGKSRIHGNGLFTTDPIQKGEVIGEFDLAPAIYETMFTIWIDCVPNRALGVLKYSNHSSKPNTEIDFPEMIALRDIKSGEELTWDYGECFD